MPKTNKEILKKKLPVIFVLDVSGSMEGAPIAALNRCIGESQEILEKRAKDLTNCEIVVGVLTFSNGARWEKQLVSLEDFYINEMKASGVTDLGAAIRELNRQLRSEGGMLNEAPGYYPPCLIFISDGEPTDDWERAFDEAYNNNGYFQVARKIAIAVGDEAEDHMDVFYKLAGKESVLEAKTLGDLKDFIRAVSQSIPVLGQSHLAESENNLADIAKDEVERERAQRNEKDSGPGDIQDGTDGPQ